MRAGRVLRENEKSAQNQRTKMAALLRKAASSAGAGDDGSNGRGAVEGGKEDRGGARKLTEDHRARRRCSSAASREKTSRKNVDSSKKLRESEKSVSVDPIIWQSVRKQIVSAPSSESL